MQLRRRVKAHVARVAVVGVTVGFLAPALMGPAHADYAPGGYAAANGQGDIVGVGSDTLQFLLDFGADGDYASNAGVNQGQKTKLNNIDATADANARLSYSATGTAQNPTVVLRAGTVPAQRPNGSGAGLSALTKDTGTPVLNYARASRLPNGTEVQTAINNGWTGLQTVQIATETLTPAVANTTNAVPVSTAQLKLIYTCDPNARAWNGSAIGGTSSAAIIPIIPQVGSGTRSTFEKDINVTEAQILTASGPGGCVVVSEENDPLAISSLGPNAIGPMSSSRLNMFNGVGGNGGTVGAGFFYNPNVGFSKVPAYPGGAVLNPGVHLLTGMTSEATPQPTYRDDRGLFVVFRASDVTALNGKNWKGSGAGQSWIQQLFLDTTAADGIGTPFFATSGLLTSSDAGAVAGGTVANPFGPPTVPNYFNCGNGTPVTGVAPNLVSTYSSNCANSIIP